MAGKYLTNSEFKRRVRQIHSDQFTILSDYHGMSSKVKVRCNSCGWQREVQAERLLNPKYGSKCPQHGHRQFDSSSFQKTINQTQDNQYTLLSEFTGFKDKVKVKCNICKRELYVWPHSLLEKRMGKKCKHAVQLDFEQASKQLNRISNGKIKLVHFSGVNRVATFKCCKCKNVWKTRASSVFYDSTGCPVCFSSKGEKAVTEYLKKNKISFKPQFAFPNCKDKRTLPFDFAVFNRDGSLNSLIEYQGYQHFINPFQYCKGDFFNKESVLSVQKHDAMKLSFCQKHGIKLIHINHSQTTSESNKYSFIANLVKRTLDKELKVS